MKKINLIVLVGMFILVSMSFVYSMELEEVEQRLRSQMPNLQIDSVLATDMRGIYEIITGDNIIYYHPETERFIFGEIWSKTGESITGNRRIELLRKRVEEVRHYISEAIQVGKGEKLVIEFVDPDCIFCRKGYDYLHRRGDVKSVVFFFILDPQSSSWSKAKYVLCAEDKEKAYREVMTGKLDDKGYKICDNENIDRVLQSHKELAIKLGIRGTPTYIVNGEVVFGADIKKIDQLLGEKEGKR